MKINELPKRKHDNRKAIFFVILALISCCASLSCEPTAFSWGKKKATAESDSIEEQNLEAQKTSPLPGTIGERCYLEGLASTLVQGYGMVAGLPGTGSSQCPETLRKKIMETMAKYEHLYGPKGVKTFFSAGSIIDSKNTAVVKVQGYIPGGALVGERFDLFVKALPDTATTSLEGGRLYTTELRIFAGEYGKVITSKVLAKGYGNIFVNPFEEKKNKHSPFITLKRSGYVLNGGINLEERPFYLILYQPSYASARAIEQKINALFGPPPDRPLFKTAMAMTPSKIKLHVPYNYRDQREHFLELVKNLYVRSDPGYIQRRARMLVEQIVEPYANSKAISYAWEAMGRTILPLIQPLYNHSNLKAAFYSARAGARLGDSLAIERLGKFVFDKNSEFRMQAIKTLGFCRRYQAKQILRKLLDDSDVIIRLEAYKGLIRFGDIAITSIYVGEDNFRLDLVKSHGNKLVYVTRSGDPKVVLFGDIRIEPPVFYSHKSVGSIIITANSNDKYLTVIRETPSKKSSGKIKASLNLDELLVLLGNDPAIDKKTGRVLGLGVTYSSVVAMLYHMCQDGSIPAAFKLQDLTREFETGEISEGRPEK